MQHLILAYQLDQVALQGGRGAFDAGGIDSVVLRRARGRPMARTWGVSIFRMSAAFVEDGLTVAATSGQASCSAHETGPVVDALLTMNAVANHRDPVMTTHLPAVSLSPWRGWEVLVTLTVNGADVEVGDRFGATGRRRRLTQATLDAQAEWWPVIMADVAEAVARQSAAVSQDVYDVILREVPQLRDDTPVLALLAASVDSNVDACLQIMRHRIDLAAVQAPAAAVEYARRLAQRGTPLTALLRAYRLGHACFSDWVLRNWRSTPVTPG